MFVCVNASVYRYAYIYIIYYIALDIMYILCNIYHLYMTHMTYISVHIHIVYIQICSYKDIAVIFLALHYYISFAYIYLSRVHVFLQKNIKPYKVNTIVPILWSSLVFPCVKGATAVAGVTAVMWVLSLAWRTSTCHGHTPPHQKKFPFCI